MLSERSEFIYRNGMEQNFSDFILSHISFATFLMLRKVEIDFFSRIFAALFLLVLFLCQEKNKQLFIKTAVVYFCKNYTTNA
jgi:hypothetical protein